ncbi:MAG: hypothetical protein V2A69_14345, partial [Pseudomonadota bacterium]
TEEEKKRLRQDEITRRGEAFARRYYNEEITASQLWAEITKEKTEDQVSMQRVIKRFLADSISLDHHNDRAYVALHPLVKEKEIIKEMEALEKEFLQTREAHYNRIANEIKNDLTRRGISGSAVLAKVESSSAWQEAKEMFEPVFKKKLDTIKARLLHS